MPVTGTVKNADCKAIAVCAGDKGAFLIPRFTKLVQYWNLSRVRRSEILVHTCSFHTLKQGLFRSLPRQDPGATPASKRPKDEVFPESFATPGQFPDMAQRGYSCEICLTSALFWPWAIASMWPEGSAILRHGATQSRKRQLASLSVFLPCSIRGYHSVAHFQECVRVISSRANSVNFVRSFGVDDRTSICLKQIQMGANACTIELATTGIAVSKTP